MGSNSDDRSPDKQADAPAPPDTAPVEPTAASNSVAPAEASDPPIEPVASETTEQPDDNPSPSFEEHPMEIHKPKPVHNWRELASEIGVIVIGILIALGLEQTVESWHLSEDVETHREALRAELAESLVYAQLVRAQEDCTRRQLNAISAAIGRGDQSRVSALVRTSALPRPSSWAESSWQAFLASDASKAFEIEERRTYSSLYTFVQVLGRKQDQVANAHARLQALTETGLSSSPGVLGTEAERMSELTAALSDMNSLAAQFTLAARNQAHLEPPGEEASEPEFKVDKARCLARGAELGSEWD